MNYILFDNILLNGVVSGIGGYGNCIGVPTVGGETEFDECYNGNILVNAMPWPHRIYGFWLH